VDFTLMNVARANIEAIDFQLDYSTTVGSGTLEIFSLATFNRRNEAQTKAGEPTVNGVGFTSGVLRWKANAGAEWSRGPMGVGVNATYYDSYRVYRASSTAAEILANVITQGSAKVDDQVYFDAFMTWRAARESTSSRRLLHSLPVPNRWQFTIGVRNILNREPPRDLQTYSTYGDPRLSSYYVTLKSEF
jgi:iron complex outermembrane recepter protein